MALLLAHTALLLLAAHATARRLVRGCLERLLATALLAWGNLVVTSLLLSTLHRLGHEAWFFRASLLLAAAVWFVFRRHEPEGPAAPADRPAALLLVAGLGTLAMLGWVSLRIAATYEPNNYDSLTYHLPRAMFYLGQDSLAHFSTGNDRQVYFPFNYNLLQLFALIYDPPRQSLTFINLGAWVVAGLALYRLGRQARFGANAAFGATWLGLTATQVLAQATATTNDLPTGAGLLCVLVFTLNWRESRSPSDAWLAGLAAGLTAGSKLTVVFFGPAAALIVLWLLWQHWRRGDLAGALGGIRAWILPGLLAGALATPFALINLAAKGGWMTKAYDFTLNRPFSVGSVAQTSAGYLAQLFLEPLHRFSYDLDFTARLNAWGTRTLFPHWNEAYAFSPLYLFPPDLNEDHVWFGFTGPVILLAGLFCLLRARRLSTPAVWLAVLGLGWFATYFLLNKWSLYNQRYFVPTLLVLCPCLGALIDLGAAGSWRRRGARALALLLASSALWLAGVYLFHNTSRPYAPLWAGDPPPPALPRLPALLTQRIGEQPRVNFDSTDGNERAFLFMTHGRHQRFMAFDRTQPDAYNVFSHWGFPRKVAYSNIEQLSSYTIVPVPTKRTAGVEFLGTLGSGQPALDYYGLTPHPETKPATASNRNVMVVLYYGPRDPGRYAKLRIKVAGLNAPDRARLTVGVDYEDNTSAELATFTATGQAFASVTRPFRRFTVRVTDANTGAALGAIDIPYRFRDEPPEIEAPQNPAALYSEQLVAVDPSVYARTTGLAPPEGPYPQWDLPVIRWAKAPVARIELPAQKHLDHLDLSFDLRLHVREAADIDVLHNGRLVATYRWTDPTGWLIKTLRLPGGPGPQVIEFRNVEVGTEPDWLDYLERYPDVKAYVISQGVPLEAGARSHYEIHGRGEHRELFLKRRTVTVETAQPLYYLFRNLRVEGFRKP